jgi:holliday junction DNA helicase RuvB
MRERTVSPRPRAEDEGFTGALRPTCLEDFPGQAKLVGNLRIALAAAQSRGEPLEHVLLSGPPGLGKTSLAHIIAGEMACKIISTSGPSIERPGDLVGILTNLGAGDVLFIDEIHRVARVVEEKLYSAMEDFRIDIVIDKGPYAKTIQMPLKRFTLVAATTRTGLLTAPLRDRFGIQYHFDFYTVEELEAIVTRSAGLLGGEADAAGAHEIARRSRGTARIANRLLRRVRDHAEVISDGVITEETANEALLQQGVDELGLDDLDRRFLMTIIDFYKGGPVGIDAIAAHLSEESDTLIDVVEPYLLKIGFVTRTPAGRCASERAFAHLRALPGRDGSQSRLF